MSNYSQKERDLIDILEGEFGYAAMRAPASGGATNRDLPDVIAGRPARPPEGVASAVFSFEVKYSSSPQFYFDREDVEQLIDFTLAFGGRGRLALRFNANKSFCRGDTDWYLMDPEDAHLTETKARIRYDEVVEECPTLKEVVRR